MSKTLPSRSNSILDKADTQWRISRKNICNINGTAMKNPKLRYPGKTCIQKTIKKSQSRGHDNNMTDYEYAKIENFEYRSLYHPIWKKLYISIYYALFFLNGKRHNKHFRPRYSVLKCTLPLPI